MKFKTQTGVLEERDFPINGREPFLSFAGAGLYLSLRNPFGQSHTLIEEYSGYIRFDSLKKGDVLRLQLVRVRKVPMNWWEQTIDWIKGLV